MEATTWERQSGSDNLEATTCDPYRLPIACELDLINAISAADIAFIILLGQPWRHETYVSTNENACFGWSVGFHNKPRDSRWRTKVCECFPMPWMRVFRTYTFISNWEEYCRNYEIKEKFVRVPCHWRFCPYNDYPWTKQNTTECNLN